MARREFALQHDTAFPARGTASTPRVPRRRGRSTLPAAVTLLSVLWITWGVAATSLGEQSTTLGEQSATLGEQSATPATAAIDAAQVDAVPSDETSLVTKQAVSGNTAADEQAGLFGQFLGTLDTFYDHDQPSQQQGVATHQSSPSTGTAPQETKAVRVEGSPAVARPRVSHAPTAPAVTRHAPASDISSMSRWTRGGLLGSWLGNEAQRRPSPEQAAPLPRQRVSSSKTSQNENVLSKSWHQVQDGARAMVQSAPKSSWMNRLLGTPSTERQQVATRPTRGEQVAHAPVKPVRPVQPLRARPSLEPSVAIRFGHAEGLLARPEMQLATSEASEIFGKAPAAAAVEVENVPTPTPAQVADITPIREDSSVAVRPPAEPTPTLADVNAGSEIKLAGPKPDWTDYLSSPDGDSPMLPSDFASIQFATSIETLGLAELMRSREKEAEQPSTGDELSPERPAIEVARQPKLVR